MPMGLERYGLKENPYSAGPLRCVENPDDCARFENIHPLKEKDIADHIAKAGAAKAAFFLVTGPSGSGKTVLARNLVATYRTSRNVLPPNFAYAEHAPGGNESSQSVLTNLITELGLKTEDLGVNFKPPAEIIDKGLAVQSHAEYRIPFRSFVTRYSSAMSKLDGSFGSILEEPATFEILQSAVQVFESSRGILVFTLADYMPEEGIVLFLKKAAGQVLRVRLQPLSHDRVYHLTQRRWEQWKAAPPLPFDKAGLDSYFQRSPRTVGRALELLKQSIEQKLVWSGDGPAWPTDQALSFPAEQIESVFDYLDRLV
jgi:hypothetical protein